MIGLGSGAILAFGEDVIAVLALLYHQVALAILGGFLGNNPRTGGMAATAGDDFLKLSAAAFLVATPSDVTIGHASGFLGCHLYPEGLGMLMIDISIRRHGQTRQQNDQQSQH